MAWAEEDEKVVVEANFEYKKDAFANFVYYNAFADPIWAHHRFDPSNDISAMVGDLAQYVHDNPLDPTHLLEVCDLTNLWVDLSFFPDKDQIIFPSGSESSDTVEQVPKGSLGPATTEGIQEPTPVARPKEVGRIMDATPGPEAA